MKFGKMCNIRWSDIVFIVYCYMLYNMDSSLGCREPQPVLHAYRYTDNSSLPDGSWLNYTCYQNYYWISGDLNRECRAGVFTGQPPVCDEYNLLIPTHSAVPEPGISCGQAEYLTDGNVQTCESTTSSTDPSWVIKFNGTKQVFSVELTMDTTGNADITRIDVYVRNSTLNSKTLCGSVNLSVIAQVFEFICPPKLIGSHIEIQGTGIGLGGLGLCEVKTKGKDWLYECGDAPFVYGGEVTSDYTTGSDMIVQYTCVEGFYYGGKNTQSICSQGQWSKVEIVCLPYDSLYNPILRRFNPVYSVLHDGDLNTCIEVADDVIEEPTLHYRLLPLNLYSFKPVELLSVTVTIGANETRDDGSYVGAPLGGSFGYEEYDAPPCKYDGLDTDPYRTRTFHCQPYTYSKALYVIITDISTNLKEFCEFKTTLRSDTSPLECIRGEYINEYKGKMNYTWDGKPCNNWADAPPDKAINTTIHKIFDPETELNYCRNIGGEKRRPWCWVDNFTTVGYCPLAFCNEICHLKEEYTVYQGKQSFSTSGKQCRDWSSGNDEGQTFLKEVFSDGVLAGTYCRNPGSSQFRAWCYVDGPESTVVAEPCNVPHCPTNFVPLIVRNNETSTFPTHLDHCYHPLDSFTVRHYFNLTIDQSTVNNLCRNFQDKLLFCIIDGGDWTRVLFECFDLPPETTSMVETSSTETSSPDSFSLLTSSIETSSPDSFSLLASSIETSSPDSFTILTSLIETSSPDSFSLLTSSIETSSPDSFSLQTSSLSPSFSVFTVDTAAVDRTDDEYRTTSSGYSDTHPVTPVKISMNITQTLDSSSFWYENTNNYSISNATCGCFCGRDDLLNASDPVVRARVEFLTRGLEMDYGKLSATFRKRNSAEDDRPSVLYVGSTAILLVVMFLAVIVISDVLNLFRFLLGGKTLRLKTVL